MQILDALLGLGTIRPGVELKLLEAVGERLYLLLGIGECAVARLQGFRQAVAAFPQRRPCLIEDQRDRGTEQVESARLRRAAR